MLFSNPIITGTKKRGGLLKLLIDTENAGVTASDTIRIPLVGTANISWGDGNSESATGTTDHTYAVAGQYVVTIGNTATSIQYNNSNDDTKLLQVQNWGSMGWTTMNASFYGCTNMTITATDFPDLSGMTNMVNAFRNCTSFTSFPLFDTSTITTLSSCWRDCSTMTSFPLLITSSVTNFNNAWRENQNLTSFPLIDTSLGTDFMETWRRCLSMTGAFPLIDTSAGIDFQSTWHDCDDITSFSIMNFELATNMQDTWRNCSSLTSFPLIVPTINTNFAGTWRQCSGLTSFPLIDVSAGEDFGFCFNSSSSLTTFPTLDLRNMDNGTSMFSSVTLDTTSWSDLLIATEANNSNNNVTWGGGNSLFNLAGSVARSSLTDDHSWTITDGATADIVDVTSDEVTFLTTGNVLNVTVPELTMDRTLLYFTYKDEDTDTAGEDAECRIRGQITSPTNIQFNVDTTPAFEKTIIYTLVHYSAISPVVIERGSEIAMTGTADNITIPATTLANSFPILSVSTNAGNFNSAGLVRGRLSSTTNIAITAGVNRSQDIDWQVVDHPDYDVTEETITITDTNVQANTTVTAFNQSQVWVTGSMDYDISSIQADDMAIFFHINTTTLRGRRTASNDVCTMTIYMVDGNGAFIVKSVRSQISDGNTDQNRPITATTIENSIPYFAGANGGMGDQNTGTPVATPEDNQMLVKFTSTIQITCERVGTSEDSRYAVQSIDFTPSF